MKRISIICFAALWSAPLFGQIDFVSANIIMLQGDTVSGWIDIATEARHEKILFKKEENSPVREYTPEEIRAYNLGSGAFYVSRSVSMDGGQARLNFLEFLVDGVVDLYFCRTRNGDHYFVGGDNGTLTDLTSEEKKVIRDGKTYIHRSTIYKGKLRSVLTNSKKTERKIDMVEFDRQSLVRLIKSYHEDVSKREPCKIYGSKKKLGVQIAPVFEYGISNLLVVFNDPVYSRTDYAGVAFAAGLSANFPIVASGKISAVVNLLGGKVDFKTPPDENNYDYTTLRGDALIQYTYPKGKFQPLVFGGVTTHFVLGSDETNTYENPTFEDIKHYFGLCGGIGLRYPIQRGKAFFIHVHVEKRKGLYTPGDYQSIKTFALRVGMFF
jgi:hypothetical protein